MSDSENNIPKNDGLTPEELGMKRFEVKTRPSKKGGLENAVFIDGVLLDWQVDLNSLMEAYLMGPEYLREAQKSFEKHFIESVSDSLGRKVTYQQIMIASKTGWI